MAAHDVNDPPRKGQYLPGVVYVDFEGGGDLEYRMVECPTCFAMVNEENLNAHEGRHESEGGSGPK